MPNARQLANAATLLLALLALVTGNPVGVILVIVVRILVSPFF